MSRVRTLLATNILTLLGLLGILAAAFGAERLSALDGSLRLGSPFAVGLAALPGAGWIVCFCVQDARSGQPKRHMVGAFILGALVAGPLAGFATDAALHRHAASAVILQPFALERVIAAIAIVGMLQETCKYAVLRYSLYTSRETEEPVDGIIYACAVAAGFAAYESFRFFSASGHEVALGAAIAHSITTTLVHLSTGSVLGLGLSLAKFGSLTSPRRGLALLGGVVAAATLNGIFTLVSDAMSSSSLSPVAWNAVAFILGLTIASFLLTSVMTRRIQVQLTEASP